MCPNFTKCSAHVASVSESVRSDDNAIPFVLPVFWITVDVVMLLPLFFNEIDLTKFSRLIGWVDQSDIRFAIAQRTVLW